MPDQTQTAYSTSLFSDATNIAAMIQIAVGLLALPEVLAVIPVAWMPAILAISGAASFALRTWKAVRPVSAILPGQVKPVEVEKLTQTQQGSEKPKRVRSVHDHK